MWISLNSFIGGKKRLSVLFNPKPPSFLESLWLVPQLPQWHYFIFLNFHSKNNTKTKNINPSLLKTDSSTFIIEKLAHGVLHKNARLTTMTNQHSTELDVGFPFTHVFFPSHHHVDTFSCEKACFAISPAKSQLLAVIYSHIILCVQCMQLCGKVYQCKGSHPLPWATITSLYNNVISPRTPSVFTLFFCPPNILGREIQNREKQSKPLQR